VLDELLGRGYVVEAATTLPGPFTGCLRQHQLVFADGSVFACARNGSQLAVTPRAYILGLPGAPPSVVLLGSVILPGELLRLRQHVYSLPLRMNASPLPGAPGLTTMANQPIKALPYSAPATLPLNAH
jgi:hypothetical protein